MGKEQGISALKSGTKIKASSAFIETLIDVHICRYVDVNILFARWLRRI